MGCLCPQQINKTQSVEITKVGESIIDFQPTFLNKNNNKFLGYGRHSEMIKLINQVLQLEVNQWNSFQNELQAFKDEIQIYLQILYELEKQTTHLINRSKTLESIVSNMDVEIPADWNVYLRPCLIIEFQNGQILNVNPEKPFYGNVQFQLFDNNGEDLQTAKVLANTSRLVSWMETLIKDVPSYTEDNQINRQFLSECCVKIQLMCDDNIQQQIGNHFTFQFNELRDQQIHEKILRFRDHSDQTLGVIGIRIQLIWDIQAMIEWWKQELVNRTIQLERMIYKIINKNEPISNVSQQKHHENVQPQDSMQFYSLMSMADDKLRSDTITQQYNIPYQIS